MNQEPELKRIKFEDCTADSWDCAACTYKNSKESFRCVICLTRKGTSTRKTKVNCDVINQQELIQQTIVSRKKCPRPLGASRLPKLKNVDRSHPYLVEVFANGFPVVITEFRAKHSKICKDIESIWDVRPDKYSLVSVQASGESLVALAGGRNLAVVNPRNLTDPKSIKLPPACQFQRGPEPRDPLQLVWSINSDVLALLTSKRVELLFTASEKNSAHLKGSVKSLTCCDFNNHDVNVLAVGSKDTFRGIFLWDLRDTSKVVQSYDSLRPCSSLKWNAHQEFIFATAHENEVKLWDTRNNSKSFRAYRQDASPIEDLFWSKVHEYELFAVSRENKIYRFCNLDKPFSSDVHSTLLPTEYSMFKFSPILNEFVAVARKARSFTWQFYCAEKMVPISNQDRHPHQKSIASSGSIFVDFDWLKVAHKSANNSDHLFDLNFVLLNDCSQLTLALASRATSNLNYPTDELVPDHQPNAEHASKKSSANRRSSNASSRQSSSGKSSLATALGPVPRLLEQELSLFNPRVGQRYSLEKYDEFSRSITFKISFAILDPSFGKKRLALDSTKQTVESDSDTTSILSGTIRFKAIFPLSYPEAVPVFSFLSSHPKTPQPFVDKLLQSCSDLAKECINEGRGCIEPCVRHLIECINDRFAYREDLVIKSDSELETEGNLKKEESHSDTLERQNLPILRTCGASFSPSGLLVTFSLSSEIPNTSLTPTIIGCKNPKKSSRTAQKSSRKVTIQTKKILGFAPINRTFSGKGKKNVASKRFQPSVIGFRWDFVDEMAALQIGWPRHIRCEDSPFFRSGNSRQTLNHVVIYDLSQLVHIDIRLANEYSVNVNSLCEMAKHNLDLVISAKEPRKDLIQFWQYCLILSQIQPNDLSFPDRDLPYSMQTLGRNVIQLWIRHFLRISDIQSLCMFSLFLLGMTVLHAPKALLIKAPDPLEQPKTTLRRSTLFPGSFSQKEELLLPNYRTIATCNPKSRMEWHALLRDNSDYAFGSKHKFSAAFLSNASQTDSEVDVNRQNILIDYLERMKQFISKSYKNPSVLATFLSHCRFVQPEELQLLAHCVKIYSTILSSSQLILPKRRFVVMWQRMLKLYKLLSNASHRNSLLLLDRKLSSTNDTPRKMSVDQVKMEVVKKQMNRCTICECRIHGMVLICPKCNHCGHVDHLLAWFIKNDRCPEIDCQCSCPSFLDQLVET